MKGKIYRHICDIYVYIPENLCFFVNQKLSFD